MTSIYFHCIGFIKMFGNCLVSLSRNIDSRVTSLKPFLISSHLLNVLIETCTPRPEMSKTTAFAKMLTLAD